MKIKTAQQSAVWLESHRLLAGVSPVVITTASPRSRHPVHRGKRKYERPRYNCAGVNVVRFAHNCTLIEMTEPIHLPPEIEQVAALLSKQPPEVRDLFRYALVLAMIDDEKAWVTSKRIDHDLTFHLPVRENGLRHHAWRRQVIGQT